VAINSDYPNAAVRMRAMKRDKFTCQYCGITGAEAELEIDHIIPVSKGGSHHISNLATSCRKCNQQKSDNPATTVIAQRASKASLGLHNMNHPLNGMFFHTYDQAGKIIYQGEVLGVDGDTVLAQLYEWFMGEPTNVEVYDKQFLYSKECKLYKSIDAWHRAYEIYNEKRRRKLEIERRAEPIYLSEQRTA